MVMNKYVLFVPKIRYLFKICSNRRFNNTLCVNYVTKLIILTSQYTIPDKVGKIRNPFILIRVYLSH